MALKLWLPTSQDIINQGVGVDFIYDNSIGGDSSFVNSPKFISAGSLKTNARSYKIPTNTFKDNQFTLATWINRDTSWGTYNDIIMCANTSTSSDHSIYFSVVNGTQLRCVLNNKTANELLYDFTFTTNKWYHLAASYDGKKLKLFINGEKKAEKAITDTLINCPYFSIGTRKDGTGFYNSGYKYYNDVRVYNTCLSENEIHELGKGLMVHYRLSDPYFESTVNLFPESVYKCTSKMGSFYYGICDITIFDGSYCHSITNVPDNNYIDGFISQSTTNCTEGQIYTYSGYIWIPKGYSWSIGMKQIEGGGGYFHQTIVGNSDWQFFSYTFTANNNTSGKLQGYEAQKYTTQHTVYLKDLQLENKDHPTGIAYGSRSQQIIRDVTGLNHNATALSKFDLKANEIGGRHSHSYYFPGNNALYINNLSVPLDRFTVSIWFNPANITGVTQYLFALSSDAGGSASQELALYINSTGITGHGGGSYTSYTYKFATNTWYHAVLTCDGTTYKTYVNNVLVGSGTAGQVLGTNLVLGARSNSASGGGTASTYFYDGLMSDFRLYLSCLTSEDIRQLYQTGAKVDNEKKIYSYDFVEEG